MRWLASWKLSKHSLADSLATASVKGDVVVVEEKCAEDQDSIKLNEAATPKEQLSPSSKVLGTEKMFLKPELSVSLYEDSIPSGARGLKQNVGEGIDQDDKKAVPGFSNNFVDCVKGTYDDDDNEGNEENEESVEEFYIQTVLMEGKERKESEIFIGGLDKGAVEDALVKVFEAFGVIQFVRIVNNPATNKSKGFAFIGFSSDDHAMRALTELEDDIEVVYAKTLETYFSPKKIFVSFYIVFTLRFWSGEWKTCCGTSQS